MIRAAILGLIALCLPLPAAAQNLFNAFLAPALPRALRVDPASVGQPFPGARARGILAFRGNPTRSWYGTGPLPRNPTVLWKTGPYCGASTDGQGTRQWCGTGWTGQPAVRADVSPPEIIFGAYDHKVHFLCVIADKECRLPRQGGKL